MNRNRISALGNNATCRSIGLAIGTHNVRPASLATPLIVRERINSGQLWQDALTVRQLDSQARPRIGLQHHWADIFINHEIDANVTHSQGIASTHSLSSDKFTEKYLLSHVWIGRLDCCNLLCCQLHQGCAQRLHGRADYRGITFRLSRSPIASH